MHTQLPELTRQATDLATRTGFPLPSAPETGAFVAALAAAVPAHGRILELGTGTGIATGWMVHGLRGREDVELTTVEFDEGVARLAGELAWPSWVKIVVADGADFVRTHGGYDLIFADSPGGKWEALEETIAAIRPSGILLLDDMTPEKFRDTLHAEKTAEVRETVTNHPDLVCVEVGWATGLIMAVKRHDR
ncbi:O-methyltransferase [Micromonospora sp. DT4]|uniref:O-methyltransferase n=1 Tax=Micromonospora sp. DT4 TaxID=3393438 RepID=UPI003CEB92F1